MTFMRCGICGKIVAIVKDTGVDTVCCGQAMTELVPNTSDGAGEKHVPVFSVRPDGVLSVKVGSVAHPMTEAHHIEWIAVETRAGRQRVVLDPLGKSEALFALLPGDTVEAVYEYCNLHGLWKA